jgi:hypothetical protein
VKHIGWKLVLIVSFLLLNFAAPGLRAGGDPAPCNKCESNACEGWTLCYQYPDWVPCEVSYDCCKPASPRNQGWLSCMDGDPDGFPCTHSPFHCS